jgi:hypothetical protein
MPANVSVEFTASGQGNADLDLLFTPQDSCGGAAGELLVRSHSVSLLLLQQQQHKLLQQQQQHKIVQLFQARVNYALCLVNFVELVQVCMMISMHF